MIALITDMHKLFKWSVVSIKGKLGIRSSMVVVHHKGLCISCSHMKSHIITLYTIRCESLYDTMHAYSTYIAFFCS